MTASNLEQRVTQAAGARERGLGPSETDYVARTRDRAGLQFSVSGDETVERVYRTHWVSPDRHADTDYDALLMSGVDRATARQRVAGKVGLVSGGGSGHEPLHGGFVGRGRRLSAMD